MRGEGHELLPVYVQIDRIPSYSNIQKLSLPKEYLYYTKKQENGKSDRPTEEKGEAKAADKAVGKQVIVFRPFNFYENWARRLWSLYALEDTESPYAPLDYVPINKESKTICAFGYCWVQSYGACFIARSPAYLSLSQLR
ncbi:hypothetical protein [Bacteroides nordii]|uniref:hypothetical protein n=1 Tax=Bacteroides nordii TaxID=291645 RepID=UPI003522852D